MFILLFTEVVGVRIEERVTRFVLRDCNTGAYVSPFVNAGFRS
jgi:hypothetical protein